MQKILYILSVILIGIGLPIGLSHCYAEAVPSMWPKTSTTAPSDEERVESILSKMSMKDKVGQLIMAEIRHVNPSDVKRYRLGGILNGGGAYPDNNKYASAEEWVALADKFYQASIDRKDNAPKVPVLWGTDAVHGHNNVYGATIFPHNIGLGATRNPDLIRKIGEATAKEVSATGIYWTFAPTVTVPMDDRWGRTYEGYSEDQAIVSELSTAMIEGLQGKLNENFLDQQQLLATAKHFIGDGGTHKGIDQGDTKLNEAGLSKYHGQGYVTALDAGVQTVMASFNSWNGKKIHGDEYLLTNVLKDQMGFDGFVVGDWNGHGQVPGCTNASCAQSVNAGVDMIMVPEEWKSFYENTLKQVRSGRISATRLDDAVRRILRVKLRMGMFDDKGPRSRSNAGKQSVIGHPEHRAIARQAVRESLVLLKNNNNTLPLNPKSNILIAGAAAEPIAHQLGGWSLTWQGTETKNSDFPGSTLIMDGIRAAVKQAGGKVDFSASGQYSEKPDVAIVIFAEPPYAEGPGDREHLSFSQNNMAHLATLRTLKAADIPVVSIFMSGRAMWVNPELNASDAFVAAWLPGSEGGGVADALFCTAKDSSCNFSGQLSYSWPKTAKQTPLNNIDTLYDPLFPVGYGLDYQTPHVQLDKLEETVSVAQSAIGTTLFKGRGLGPFSAVIQEQGLNPISASQPPATTKNNGVQTEVFDRVLQEDAQRIRFNGTGLNSWQLQSANKVNWEDEAKKAAILTLDIRTLKASEQPIFFSTVCGSGCNGSLPMQKTLQALTDWKTMGISLSCLEKLGVDLGNITHPLVILTPGNWELEISNIRLEAESSISTEQCPL